MGREQPRDRRSREGSRGGGGCSLAHQFKAQSTRHRGTSTAPSTTLRAAATDVKYGKGTISAQAPRAGILPGQEWRPRWDTVLPVSPSSLPRVVYRDVFRQACARRTRALLCRSRTRNSNCSRASSRSSRTRQGGVASSQATPSTGCPWQLRSCGSAGSRRQGGCRL